MESSTDKSNSGWYKSLCKYINNIHSTKPNMDNNESKLSINSDFSKSPMNDSIRNISYLTPKIDRIPTGRTSNGQSVLDYKSVFKSNTRKRQLELSPSELKIGMDKKWLKLDENISTEYVHIDTPHPFVRNSRLSDISNDVEKNDIKIRLLEEQTSEFKRSLSHMIHEEVKKIVDIDNVGPFGSLSKKPSPSLFTYTARSRSLRDKKSLFTPTRAQLLTSNGMSQANFSRWSKPLKFNETVRTEVSEEKKSNGKSEKKVAEKRKNVFSGNFDDIDMDEPKIDNKKGKVTVLDEKPEVLIPVYKFSSPIVREALCSKCKTPIGKENKEDLDVSNLSKNDEKNSDSEVSAASSPDYSKESEKISFTNNSTSKVWSCQTCFVNNSIEKEHCACCNASKIVETPAASAPSTNWSCPDCMVKNKDIDLKCVCCTASKPSTTVNSSKEKENKKWSCEVCLVSNEPEKDKCVCCESPRPGTKTQVTLKPEPKTLKATTFTPEPTGFLFGLSSSKETDDKNKAGTTTTTTNSSSIFGITKSDNKTVENTDVKSTIASSPFTSTSNIFGIKEPENKPENKAENKPENKPVNVPFSFGTKPSETITPMPKQDEKSETKSTTQSFTTSATSIFGSSLQTQTPVPPPVTNFNVEQKNTSSLFGASNTSSVNSFFTPAPKPIESNTNSIFGTSTITDNSKPSIFGTSTITDNSKPSIFGVPKPADTLSVPTFNSIKPAEPSTSTSIFGSSTSNIFGSEKKNETSTGLTNIFGSKPDEMMTSSSIFGSSFQSVGNNAPQPSAFSFGGNSNPSSSSGLFGNNGIGTTGTNMFQSPFNQPPVTNNAPTNPFTTTPLNPPAPTGLFGTSASAPQPTNGFNFGNPQTIPPIPSTGFNFNAPSFNDTNMGGSSNEPKGFNFNLAPTLPSTGNAPSFQFSNTITPSLNMFAAPSMSAPAPSPMAGRRIAQARRKLVKRC